MAKKPIYPQQEMAVRLREALESSGVSQAELARGCGVSDQAVHDWLETGRIGKHHFVTICHLTKKDFSYFFVGLKTWRRAAAIALISLSLPHVAMSLSDEAGMDKNTVKSSVCVLCQIAKILMQRIKSYFVRPFTYSVRFRTAG